MRQLLVNVLIVIAIDVSVVLLLLLTGAHPGSTRFRLVLRVSNFAALFYVISGKDGLTT